MAREFIADLHIHSHYSRATSRDLDLEHLWVWAQRKGLAVVGTGDFTHPGWFAELEQKLVPTGDGLYRLREEGRALCDEVPPACRGTVRFMLSVEISSIYKRDGRTRKVHNLVYVPDLESAAAISRALARIGNLSSDGRPILGLDSRDLLQIVLDTSNSAVLIPAHIWTPWFSALGSKSGFDSIEACFADLAPQIFAVETGLSSDPAMNWRLSALDRYCLVSNSDAHSPGKLAREANRFCCEPSYHDIFGALRHPRREGFLGTIEFFPEEGKYHLDGHRKCDQRMTPAETRTCGGVCPHCGKPVTMGVLYRVEELADREAGTRPECAREFVSLVGFNEVVGQVLGVGPTSKQVARVVRHCQQELGCELDLLRSVPLEELSRVGGPVLAEAVRRMRAGEVRLEGGYDGEFGTVHLIEPDERRRLGGQTALFALSEIAQPGEEDLARTHTPDPDSSARDVPAEDRSDDGPLFGGALEPLEQRASAIAGPRVPAGRSGRTAISPLLDGISGEQRRAALHRGSPVIIWAGPGSGKTRTLTRRIALRVEQGTDPAQILAVTFTTRAAAQMRERLARLLGDERSNRIRVCTFHALALAIVNDQRERETHSARGGAAPVRLVGETERVELLARLLPEASPRQLQRHDRAIGRMLAGMFAPPGDALDPSDQQGDELLALYIELLRELEALDLDMLIPAAVQLLGADAALLARWRERSRMLCVDEYQDVDRSQYELVRLLGGEDGADLCVIGDSDQAIYAFRGADPRYFLRFTEDYPDAVVLTLERSYRTASALLRAARQVVSHNPNRIERQLWSTAEGAARVTVYQAPTAAAEAEFVVHSIERLMGGITLFSLDSGRTVGADDQVAAAGELSFCDIAVLYRTSAQAAALREALDRSGMPYRCVAKGGSSPLAPVLDLLRRLSGEDFALSCDKEQTATLVSDQPARTGLRILVQRLCDDRQREPALELADALAAQLYGVAPSLALWGPLALGLGATAFLEADRVGGRAEALSLLTLHASKGLEFPVVFIVGCEEGLLPHLFPGEEEAERVDEERRLLYVGMTRAERLLLLTHAARRPVQGRMQERVPSRFLAHIAPELVSQLQPDRRFQRRRTAQLDLFS